MLTADNMSQLLKKDYNDYTLYAFEEKYLPLLEKVMKGDYSLEQLIVDKSTAYIAKISIEGKIYLYKKLYKEPLKKQILSLFRKDLSLDILEKTHKYRDMGFCELVDVYGIGIEKKFNKEQFLLMEYIEGRIIDRIGEYKILEDFLLRLHNAHVYHGDVHPYNFIVDTSNKLRVLDTKLKGIYIGNIGGHLDFFKIRHKQKNLPPYPYTKNLVYYFCAWRYNLKEFRKKKRKK